MVLRREYPACFERLWKIYPKWPTGRSKKEPSFKAFEKARRELKFSDEDLVVIERDILERSRFCETWQTGNKFGPPMMATYCNQHLWNEPYLKTKQEHRLMREPDEQPTWKARGYRSQQEYEAAREVAHQRAQQELRRTGIVR